jgi:amino acid adenylation domain-containing protein
MEYSQISLAVTTSIPADQQRAHASECKDGDSGGLVSYTRKEHDQILQWNSTRLDEVQECLHWRIEEHCRSHPNREAIKSTARTYTYRELNDASARLAFRLRSEFAVRPEVIVPICFPKSAYTIVAMLAVLRAGGAYALLDPSQPLERLRSMLGKIKGSVAIASPTTAWLVEDVPNVISLSDERIGCLPCTSATFVSSTEVKPNNACTILFTSGSTGNPKGIVLEHRQLCKVFTEHGKSAGFCLGLRVLQFSAYTFDTCNSEIFETLFYGGVVCVPSEEERMNDPEEFATANSVEWAFSTPSLASLLRPSAMPTLKTLAIGGEVIPLEVINRWKNHVRLIITYGPAECSIYTSITDYESNKDVGTIGKAHGSRLWIVNPENHEDLLPTGSVGELLIEGPIVAREYLNDPELSSKSFIQAPTWRSLQQHLQKPGRFYTTGDLMKYDPDGRVRFVGRKDNQIKLRGQRIELGEVEHHVGSKFLRSKSVFCAIVAPTALGSVESLAAFVHLSDSDCGSTDANGIAIERLGESYWQEQVQTARAYLVRRLPSYMVPSSYVPMARMPLTPSCKIDRSRLRNIGAGFGLDQLSLFSSSKRSGSLRQAPSTDMESLLQAQWATTLGSDLDQIHAEDNFFRLGGNSLLAMRLVSGIRDQGYSLTIRDVFGQPRLKDQAAQIKIGKPSTFSVEPFSLLTAPVDKDAVRQQAAMLADVTATQIQDVFPCTPLQEGLLAMTAKRPGDYVSQNVYRLPKRVDLGRFKRAWVSVIERTPILRTRIVDLPGQGLVQVIVEDDLQLMESCDVMNSTDPFPRDVIESMGPGSRLCLSRLDSSPTEDEKYFSWAIHHALYDGWSLRLILDAIDTAYHQAEKPYVTVPPPAFQTFVKEILKQQQSSSLQRYWRDQLSSIETAIFPKLPTPNYTPFAKSTYEHRVTDIEWPQTNITPATTIRTAWGILERCYTGSEDIVFGSTVSGRQVEVPGIGEMIAPTIATVPVRMFFGATATVAEAQRNVQEQSFNMSAFEQVGLHHLRHISEAAESACQFQTLLVVQPLQDSSRQLPLFQTSIVKGFEGEAKTYALVLDCQLRSSGVDIRVNFDPEVLEGVQVTRMMAQFEHVLRQICNPIIANMQIRCVQIASREDLCTIWRQNSHVPESIDTCVHDLIASNVENAPHAAAICAWDGQLTYKELDVMSSQLARRLYSLGVRSNTIVPLCFDKSVWVPVAALAVMKASGASTILDITQPEQRLQEIVRQIKPKVTITSTNNLGKAKRIGCGDTIIVDIEQSVNEASTTLPTVELPQTMPTSLLYLVFTSGSTGTPKGVMITHSNFASAIHHQRRLMDYGPSSRVYDFATYAFDISWSNMLHTLSTGGCVCIPSDQERKDDLVGSLNRMKATAVQLTPSTARLLRPDAVPMLEVMILSGESESVDDLDSWASRVHLKQMYGPAECTPLSVGQCVDPAGYTVASIGRGMGTVPWVVDHGGQILVPQDVVGELWLEGPLVGAGYLNDKEMTAKAFVDNPAWLVNGSTEMTGRCGRLYQTGDLVRYNQDGLITFVGRKDHRVKIRGQRVELGEVEHHLQQLLDEQPGSSKLVVDVIRTHPTADTVALTAFVSPPSRLGALSELQTANSTYLEDLQNRLAQKMPRYMIPSLYVPVEAIPMTANGKRDRRRLQEIGSLFAREMRQFQEGSRGTNRPPSTPSEKRLQALWAIVLEIDADMIGINDHFLYLGGDSISAMRLAALAQRHKVGLRAADVLQFPRFIDLSSKIQEQKVSIYCNPLPYSLLQSKEDDARTSLVNRISSQLEFTLHHVQDVLPTTAIQALCADAAMHTPPQGSFWFHIDIPKTVDPNIVLEFCHTTWSQMEILRTVFVKDGESLLQVIPCDISTPLEVIDVTGDLDMTADKVFNEQLRNPLQIGAIFTKFLVFRGTRCSTRLGIRLSHAHFDGVSLMSILKYLSAHIQGLEVPYVPQFSGYIRHVKDQERRSLDYWRKLLKGSIPLPLSPTGAPSSIITSSQAIEHPPRHKGYTAANVFLASCAEAIARIRNINDVVMTTTVSGRTMLPPGLDDVVGPCLNQIPLRVRLDPERTFDRTLRATQQAQLDMLTTETATLADIYQACAEEWPVEQRKLFYNVQFQNVGLPSVDLLGDGVQTSMNVFGSMGVWKHSEEVWIIARPSSDGWNIDLSSNACNSSIQDLEKIAAEIMSILKNVSK